jgi:hypothetical protein
VDTQPAPNRLAAHHRRRHTSGMDCPPPHPHHGHRHGASRPRAEDDAAGRGGVVECGCGVGEAVSCCPRCGYGGGGAVGQAAGVLPGGDLGDARAVVWRARTSGGSVARSWDTPPSRSSWAVLCIRSSAGRAVVVVPPLRRGRVPT